MLFPTPCRKDDFQFDGNELFDCVTFSKLVGESKTDLFVFIFSTVRGMSVYDCVKVLKMVLKRFQTILNFCVFPLFEVPKGHFLSGLYFYSHHPSRPSYASLHWCLFEFERELHDSNLSVI